MNNLGGMAITIELVNWIYTHIPEGSIILELGSGYGTAELVKKYTVYSVEDNIEWVNKIPGSNYIHAPIKDNWYDISFIEKIDSNYDLLLVDGPAEPDRFGILKYIDLFYNGSLIILDDVDRPDELKITKELCSLLKKSYVIEKGPRDFAIIS